MSLAAIFLNATPMQEYGNAVMDVLFGDVNPSGKLPLTFPNIENEVGFKDYQYPGLPVGNPVEANVRALLRWDAGCPCAPNEDRARERHRRPRAIGRAEWLATSGLIATRRCPSFAQYTEKLEVGYRWYNSHKVTPKFEFGFGLSYTTFGFSDLSVSGRTVKFTVKNTGSVCAPPALQQQRRPLRPSLCPVHNRVACLCCCCCVGRRRGSRAALH